MENEKEKKPIYSIVTACYNGEEHGMLDGYFKGVLNQTYENIELIFVNDGSTDNTEEIFGEYEPKIKRKFYDCKYICFDENRGVIDALYEGFEHAEGDYITILDSDDIMLPHKAENDVGFLEKHGKYGMVYSDGYVVRKEDINKPIRRLLDEREIVSGDIYEEILIQKTWFTPGTYCFRKKCLDVVQPLLKKFEGRGQNHLIQASIAYHYKVGYNDVEPVLKYVVRFDSLSHSLDLENIRFKTFDREKLDKYIIEKFGASEETKMKIDAKYTKRKVLYYFLAGEKKKCRSAYNGLRSLYESGAKEKIPFWVFCLATFIYLGSFIPLFFNIFSKVTIKSGILGLLFR